MFSERGSVKPHLNKTNDYFATFEPTHRFHNILDNVLDGADHDSPRRWFFLTNIAYALSVRAAKALVDMSDKHGIIYPADHYVSRVQVLVDTPYITLPHLILNDDYKTIGNDSDVQRIPRRVAGGPASAERQAWEKKQRAAMKP